MAKNKISITNELIQDLKTYGSAMCVSLATQTRDEMYEEAKYAIDAFYNDYKPLYYRRHYYNFEKNSFQKYYKNPHNSIVRGGVELTPFDLDNIYRADASYVFELVYSGQHGNVGAFPHQINNIPRVMSPSPMEILLDKRDYIISNIDAYTGKAVENARKKTYSVIKV